MPPYQPAVSRAQERKLFALAEVGQISKADALGKARAAKATGKPLPERVKHHPHGNLGKWLHPKKAR